MMKDRFQSEIVKKKQRKREDLPSRTKGYLQGWISLCHMTVYSSKITSWPQLYMYATRDIESIFGL